MGSNNPGPYRKQEQEINDSKEILLIKKLKFVVSGKRKKEKSVHTDSPRLADGSIPILPVIIDASSDRISPNMLFVTIVSNCKNVSG